MNVHLNCFKIRIIFVKIFKTFENSGAVKGATGHLPPLGLRQALGRECTQQADQGENGNLQL